MKIYLAGAMRGIPDFNAPAFRNGARRLREAGHEVFSPVEHDELAGFDWSGHSGNLAQAEDEGFGLRKALAADLSWICLHADAVVMLPGWEKSLGATAEVATAHALGLPATGLDEFLAGE